MFINNLLTKIGYGILLSVAPLDKERQGRRIRHPQAVTHKGQQIEPHSPVWAFIKAGTSFLAAMQRMWGHGSGAKEYAPAVPFLCGALSCGYPIRLLLNHKGKAFIMLYTFLIAQRGQRLAQVRTRTISAIAQNETKAREQLAGLPLVFVRCTPTKGAAV